MTVCPNCSIPENGRTPLISAAIRGHANCVRILLQVGADPNVMDSLQFTALVWAAHYEHVECMKIILESPNMNRIHFPMALMYALLSRNTDSVEMLLSAGADPRIEYGDLTPLMYVNDVDCLKLLLDSGADLNQQVRNGWTALMQYASAGRGNQMKMLLDAGADETLQNAHGSTALHIANLAGRMECIDILKDWADIPHA